MIISFLYGISDWTRHEIVHYLPILSLTLFIGFVIEQYKSKSPLIELSLFKNTVFAMSNLAALIHYSATFAIGFILSLYLQLIRGMDASIAGAFLLIQPIVMAILSPRAGSLSDRFSSRIIASIGMGIMMISLFLFSFLNTQTSLIMIGVNLALIGVGFALFSAPNNNAIMSAVKPQFYGVSAAILAIMRLIGQAMSMAIVTLVLSIFVVDTLSENYSDYLLTAFDYLFCLFSILCLIALIASLMRGKENVK